MKTRKLGNRKYIFDLILLVVVIYFIWTLASPSFGFEYVSREEIPIAPGVLYTKAKLEGKDGVEAINLLEVDIDNPHISLEPTKAHGFAIGLETVRRQAQTLEREGYEPLASFNTDFYNTSLDYGGVPNGTLIINREIISAISGRLAFGIFPSGQVQIGKPKMECRLSIGDTSLSIELVNKPKDSWQAVLYTPRYSPTMTTKTNDNGVEVIIYTGETGLYLDKEVVGIVREIRVSEGNSTIPIDGLVVSASGDAANWLMRALKVGSECIINITLEPTWNDLCHAVGGDPIIVEKGRLSPQLASRGDHSTRHPRTAIGIKGNKVYFITVDGRQPNYSEGVTLSELARILINEGIEMAMNVDGGGSTTFALRYPGDESLSIANRPSDSRERAVSTAIHIIRTASKGN